MRLVKTNQSRVWVLGLEQSLSSDTLFAMCMACDNTCMFRWSVLEQALHLPSALHICATYRMIPLFPMCRARSFSLILQETASAFYAMTNRDNEPCIMSTGLHQATAREGEMYNAAVCRSEYLRHGLHGD